MSMSIVKVEHISYKLFDNYGRAIDIDHEDMYKVAKAILNVVGLDIKQTVIIPPEPVDRVII